MVVKELQGKCPAPLILIVLLLGWTVNVGHTPIGCSEFFAGVASIATAYSQSTAVSRGLAHAHDIELDNSMDILSSAGFSSLPQL